MITLITGHPQRHGCSFTPDIQTEQYSCLVFPADTHADTRKPLSIPHLIRTSVDLGTGAVIEGAIYIHPRSSPPHQRPVYLVRTSQVNREGGDCSLTERDVKL